MPLLLQKITRLAGRFLRRLARLTRLAARRLARPFTRRRLIGAAIVIVSLCVLAGGAVFGLRLYRNSPGQRIFRVMTTIERADAQIAHIDTALTAPLSTETTTQVTLARTAIPAARQTLSNARTMLDAIPPASARAPKTAARLAKVRRSLDARLALLDSAGPLLDATSQAATALMYGAQGWQNLRDGAALTDSAGQEFAHQTQDALVSSHEASTQAADAYAQAQEQFSAAARALPAADFTGYVAYTQQRTLMTQSALLACEDWINGHYKDANADVSAYNGFARAAARIADAGLQLPSDLVASAYQDQTKATQPLYESARAEVLRADAALR
ncbi:MAG: hypothetical protein FWD65_05995 [Coriobacteriia bacterium]|nr:hypothetical protein [Coriobacteriia bacterium]